MTLLAQSQPQQHRISSCHRHPTKPLTGFCAACLRERLAGIDPDTHQEAPVTQLAAELRRSKSYSSTTNPNASSTSSTTTNSTTTTGGSRGTGELRRKSCDVKPRSTLSDLFDLEKKRCHSSFSRKPKGLELKEEENNGEIRVSNVIPGEAFEEDGEFKTMKEFIDLEWEKKKHGGKDFRSFWEAASSTLSKKLGILQRKQNNGKREDDKNAFAGMEKATRGRKFRETQSEVGEYGFGRRSCDTDARLSADAARLSIDDFRYSFDEPRASCDGYFIGRTCPRLAPLVPVVEDGKLSTDGGDGKMSCDGSEDVNERENEGGCSPGGTVQTRDYYSDRRRRSFDRLSLNKRVGLVDDDVKSVMNAKVSPETVGLFHGAKLLVTEKELRDSNWYSTKGYGGDNVDSMRKDSVSVVDGVDKKRFVFKKSQRWRRVWKMWGMIQGKTESKCGDEESNIGRSMDDVPVAESWQKLSGVANGEADGVMSQKLVRSYTVSARESSQLACSTTGIDAKKNGMKSREDIVLQRNRSARYSPNNLDNGLLRFYLTPLRSYGRSKSGKSRLKNSHSMAR